MHTSAGALGVAVIFQQSLLAFTILKLCGQLTCFIWHGALFVPEPVGLGRFKAAAVLDKRHFIVVVLSLFQYHQSLPSLDLLSMAFLPQFTNPNKGHLTLQLLELGAIFIVCTLLVFWAGWIYWLANSATGFNQSPKAEVVMNRVAGSVFAALAVKLALTEGGAIALLQLFVYIRCIFLNIEVKYRLFQLLLR